MKGMVVLLLALLVAPQDPDVGKIESSFDKKANFPALRTYTWVPGYNAFNPDAHKMIVAAVEAEMATLGFTKVTSGADVTLAYYTVTGTVVDLKALDKVEREGKGGATPTKARARLVVIMRGAPSNQQLWSASTREYIDPDPAELNAKISTVTARLFETFPGRKTRAPK